MIGSVELRPARYDEAEATRLTLAAQGYYASIYGGEDTSPIDADEFAPPGGGFLIGHLDGRAVAMGGWHFLDGVPPVPADRAAEIRRMYVDPEVRRRGVARALLLALEEDAARAGADLMVLETGRPQTEAIAFYERCGYVEVPRFGFYAEAPLSVSLGKRLPPAR